MYIKFLAKWGMNILVAACLIGSMILFELFAFKLVDWIFAAFANNPDFALLFCILIAIVILSGLVAYGQIHGDNDESN